ncbi:hypothetical protein LWI28_003075 [Acer negundo]|uniref:Uncharacterized protein n=1 Tax=Acer negundo TaxID=4023 RepID=A0AAD5JGM3_ACENE|nr:hypothetical protein LWI28_003075 [Acer negundo]KAK4860034.1 hypothetical protein QYF36_016161 [Acer negundo]
MNARAYVVIFFFWAVLVIITPTLILLSDSSKPDLYQNEKLIEVMKPRKMMAYFEKHLTTPDSPAPNKLLNLAPAPAPGPAPAPAPVIRLSSRSQHEPEIFQSRPKSLA